MVALTQLGLAISVAASILNNETVALTVSFFSIEATTLVLKLQLR